MAKIILKCRYIKSGKVKHSKNLINYIATRDGIEKIDDSWKHLPATVEQLRFIDEILKDLPDTASNFEYKDYLSSPTRKNASEFISRAIEDNPEVINQRKKYVEYIAQRPRVEKRGSHGLFTDDNVPINLSKVSETVANHEGVVWTDIISLKREDAERLGYDNSYAWQKLIRSNVPAMAESMKIPIEDLRWYAAFHNEGHHPHIHVVAYSVGKQPYMTEQGILKLKSAFARDIFRQDLLQIYSKQTIYRDDIRERSREILNDISEQINKGNYENKTVEMLLEKLINELGDYTGRKVYGYLPKSAKNIIDAIVDEIAKDEKVSALYTLWYEQRNNVILTYMDNLPKKIPLSQNKEFKNIRNAVVNEAFKLISQEDEQQEKIVADIPKEITNNIQTQKSDATSQVTSHKGYVNNKVSATSITLSSLRLFARISQIIQDDIERNDNINQHLEKKLQQKIEEKKIAQGQKM